MTFSFSIDRLMYLFFFAFLFTNVFSQTASDSDSTTMSVLDFKHDFLSLENEQVSTSLQDVSTNSTMKKGAAISLAATYAVLQLTPQSSTVNNLWEKQQRAIENYNPSINHQGKVED
ncbi:MAG: hypothetical protein ACPG4Z_07230 [Chitinophagales bacterium]